MTAMRSLQEISDQGKIPDNQMTASSQYGTGYSLRMVDSMVTGAMAGVPKKPTGMTIGCRLILEK